MTKFYQSHILKNSGICDVCADCGCPVCLLHVAVRLPILSCAVKMVEGDFRFCWMISPNVGQTHKENPNLVKKIYMTSTLNDIYKQYNKLHEH